MDWVDTFAPIVEPIEEKASAEIKAAAAGTDLEGWPLDLSGKGPPPPEVKGWPDDMKAAYNESTVPDTGWPEDVLSGGASTGASQVTGWPADLSGKGTAPPTVKGWPDDMAAAYKESAVPSTGWPGDVPEAKTEPSIVASAEAKEGGVTGSEEDY